ncbi:MAG: single-stranded DNA-binding protein [Bacteroidetes bacterium]|nr:single-stranded DNA-binding protein [Bacteroidota bacterium]
MANGVNKVILVGNLGKDPVIQTFDNNVKKATFSLATTETTKDASGNKIQKTEWHNIVLWRGLAEVTEAYLKKGNQIYLEGKIRSRSYDDKEGNKKYITEIVADSMIMLGGRRDGNGAEPASAGNVHPEESSDVLDQPAPTDDLPF